LFGGHGTLPFADNAVNADPHREPKTQTQRFVYARRDTEDGPLEIIPPEESMWYKFMSAIFTLPKMQSSQRHFTIASVFRIPNFLN